MDRLYLASVIARERQAEISKELAVRHMLNQAAGNLRKAASSKRLALRLVPAVTVIALIAMYLIG